MRNSITLSALLTAIWLSGTAAVVVAQQADASDPAAAGAAAAAPAAAGETDGTELAKKLTNPIADLVSLPFQFNWENGVGPLDQTRYILNIQPVMPFSLSPDLNMIVRVIAPIVSQPAPAGPGGVAASGVSDLLASFFFSPTHGPIVWGAGPAISVPSTSIPSLGTEKWSAGPTFVVLKQQGGLTYGTPANQVWSFAGNVDRAASAAKLSSFGTFPASYMLGGGYFVVHPDNGATWKIRAAITILMPHKKGKE